MFKDLKLGQKLIVLLWIISVIPLLAVSIANYSYGKAQLEQKTIDALQAVTSSRASHINHSIQLRQEQAKEFAGAYLPRQLQETGSNDPEVIQEIQDDIMSTFQDLNREPSTYYKNIDQRTDIEIVSVWDVHGNIIASTDPTLIGRKMPIDYIRYVYERGTYFVGFERNPLTNQNLIIILEEIRNAQSNEIVGAIALMIRAKVLDEITTSREGLGKSGETYIIDKKLRMITQSRFIKDSILNIKVTTQGAQACFSGKKAPKIYKNYMGVPVLGVQKYLPDEEWCLMSEIDATEALAPVRALRNRTLFIGGFLILIISVLAYFASRKLIQPVLKLHEASQEVGKGNYQVEVQVDSKDEIGELSKAFNQMAKNLAKVTQELEEKSKTLFKNLALTTRQKKELKEVNQELDSFVYTASHDLRAPLRGIASFATFLEEDYKSKLDQNGKEYIDEIRKGATKMSALIDDLLQLSRISRIKNPYEDVNVKELLDSVLERIKYDIQANKVQLNVGENLPVIRCDRIKIAEVFLNLINNAIKFSSKNNKENPRVDVGYIDEGEFHKFFIKDNGIGIDPKYHGQVFGLFKRLHTDKEYEGTGAGLSIVKRVIDDHQGKIWIESEVGHGATFYFTIPKGLKSPDKSDEDLVGEEIKES